MTRLSIHSLIIVITFNINLMGYAFKTSKLIEDHEIISERMTSFPEGPLTFYYPQNIFDLNGKFVFLGCKVVRFPAEINCFVISGPHDLADLGVCPKKLYLSEEEELHTNTIESFRLNDDNALVTWLTSPIADGENVTSSSFRHLAIINLTNNSLKLTKLEIQTRDTQTSFVVPFKDSYEITYCENNITLRRRYDFQHIPILYWSAHMNLGYCHRDGSSNVLIMPSPGSTMSSLHDKSLIIIEPRYADAMELSDVTERGDKTPITTIDKFSPVRLAIRHGFLTLCGELSFNQSKFVQCQQYDSRYVLKMMITLKTLNSVEDVIAIEPLENGGFLMLAKRKFPKFSYKFIKFHSNTTEEVISEEIESEYHLEVPAPKIEISNLGDLYCIHWFCGYSMLTKIYGPITKFKITRVCKMHAT